MNPARLGFSPNGRGISPSVTSLAEKLGSLGYRTHHIGKWHIGDTTTLAWPEYQGFDTWFGFLNQWCLKGPLIDGVIEPAAPVYHNPWLRTESDPEREYKGHLTDILTNNAIEKIFQYTDGSPLVY